MNGVGEARGSCFRASVLVRGSTAWLRTLRLDHADLFTPILPYRPAASKLAASRKHSVSIVINTTHWRPPDLSTTADAGRRARRLT
jgi:hypothetical protein